jgi:hypothetical protein
MPARMLVESLALLLKQGLIQRTRQGGKKPLGPTLYALTCGTVGNDPVQQHRNGCRDRKQDQHEERAHQDEQDGIHETEASAMPMRWQNLRPLV